MHVGQYVCAFSDGEATVRQERGPAVVAAQARGGLRPLGHFYLPLTPRPLRACAGFTVRLPRVLRHQALTLLNSTAFTKYWIHVTLLWLG